jgi:hypothetical protein
MCPSQDLNRFAEADRSAIEGISSKAQQLGSYLYRRVQQEGEIYVKSRFVAEDIDLSPKEIGAAMRQLQDAQLELSIEQWAYTNGTTWRVSG